MLVWQEGSGGGVPACCVLKHASKLLGIIPSQSCPQVVNIHQNIDDSHLSCQCLSETSWEAAWQSLKGSIVLPLFFRRERGGRRGGVRAQIGNKGRIWLFSCYDRFMMTFLENSLLFCPQNLPGSVKRCSGWTWRKTGSLIMPSVTGGFEQQVAHNYSLAFGSSKEWSRLGSG